MRIPRGNKKAPFFEPGLNGSGTMINCRQPSAFALPPPPVVMAVMFLLPWSVMVAFTLCRVDFGEGVALETAFDGSPPQTFLVSMLNLPLVIFTSSSPAASCRRHGFPFSRLLEGDFVPSTFEMLP